MDTRIPKAPTSHATRRRPRCPHCHHHRIHRWGQFAGRQRYRCTRCKRTFSTYTGTALHYLKRVDRWNGFCLAMDRCHTVRETARLLGIHKDTVFRWRHRFLATLTSTETVRLRGHVVVAQAWFRHCRKGARPGPSAGAHAWPGSPTSERRVLVVLARDRRTHGFGRTLGPQPLHPEALARTLGPVLGPDVVLIGGRGRYSPLAACALRLGLGYRKPASGGSDPATVETPTALALRLRRWLRPFRGVATRYLDHYLLWFRALESTWSSEAWDLSAVARR
jgi:transposase-like protein